ncbi:uncharacterized protein [Solanum lycopersicum]|uniref:uncharacterized protein n=1 Tax=Solanum lycopersicum TaxID=4081 RepID=UPI003748E9C5
MVTTTVRITMSEMETTTTTTTLTGVTMLIETTGMGLMSLLKIVKLLLGMVEIIELQTAQLSATVNTRQPGTLPSNTVQNPKNDAHCMAITTQSGRKTIDPPMPSTEENVRKDNENVVKGSGETEGSNGKDAEVHIKLSINVPLVEALEQMPGYAKFMQDSVTKKISVPFEYDDRLQHCCDISTRSLVQKKEDLGAFTIPCIVGSLHFVKALCDLGESINLMPLSIYKKLGLGNPKPTAMRLLMADQTVKRPIGILHDVLVEH